jgi:hypothetical protein
MAYVYRHIRLDKNEPCYIGIAKEDNELYRRANAIKIGRNPLHQNIVDKTELLVEIILDDLTWEEACEKEKEFIKLYGRIDQGTGVLTNLTDGGEGSINRIYSEDANKQRSEKLKGRKFSVETLAKMKESRNLRTDSQKGYKRSEESKLKNRLAHLGKILTEEDKNRKSESLKKYYSTHVHHSKGKPSWNKGIKKISNTLIEKNKC